MKNEYTMADLVRLVTSKFVNHSFFTCGPLLAKFDTSAFPFAFIMYSVYASSVIPNTYIQCMGQTGIF